jgi:hypothetical protein
LKQLVTITTEMMDGRRLHLRNQATRKWNVTRVKPLKGKPSNSQIECGKKLHPIPELKEQGSLERDPQLIQKIAKVFTARKVCTT